MAKADRSKATNEEIMEAKRHIRASGSGAIARSYFKETHCSVENTEIDSKGLYCFEKLVRLAFIQAMRDDVILGYQDGFINYITSLNDDFEAPKVSDWIPNCSADRASDFMTSFYRLYAYQWRCHGRTEEKSLQRFLEIMRESLDFSYVKLSEKFNTLPKELKDIVNKTFFLTNNRIDAWYEEKLLEISST